ncbi:hypothetical protein ES319_A04G140100v1, partial [Gossypium barbadense]
FILWKEGSCFFPLNFQYHISNIRYNVSSGECYPVLDKSAPIYITVGDGGNQESLAGRFLDPQPKYSTFREASYGHSTLEIQKGHMHSTIRTAMMMGKKWQLTHLYYTISTVKQYEMKKTEEAPFE